jgi:phosphoglycerol transferase MdoB-like AlkP superfamily enzyme
MFRAKSADIERKSWFEDDHAAYRALSRHVVQTQHVGQKKKNVVLIILESFHRDMIRSHETYGVPAPFLKDLADKSLFFENAFANGRASMDALPSTILGLPRLFKAPFVRTSYFKNHIESLPQLIKKYGYSSSLYHGAHNGSLYFDSFAEVVDFDQFHGFNEYAEVFPNESETDQSKWGIYDDQFMQYMVQDLSLKTHPFFATLFTVSSHNPFDITQRLIQNYPIENDLSEAYRSVHYSDDALKQMFAAAKQTSWYKDTVFVITADHSSYYWSTYKNHNDLGKHHVPMLVFDPSGDIQPQVSSKVVQHLDMPATVLDVMGVLAQEADHILPYGQRMLALNEPGHALLRTSSTDFLWVNDAEITRFNMPNASVHHVPLTSGMFLPRPASEAPQLSENRLKAAIQLYMNGLIEDRMYPQQLE